MTQIADHELSGSDYEWLGKIPDHWYLGKFRHLFTESKEINGKEPVGDMLSVSGYRGVELKEYSSESLKRDSEDLETYRVVRPGQLAVNTMWLNYAGLGVSELTGHVSPAYRAYWISETLNPRFVHHMMRSQVYVNAYSAYLTGVRPNSLQMSRENLLNWPILVPPLDEQAAIAVFLDSETAQIDTLIKKQQQLIETLTERRKAVVFRAVTRGLDKDVPLRDSGVDWLGKIPAHWGTRRISEVATLTNGFPFDSDLFDSVGDVPLVRIRDIRSSVFETFVPRDSVPINAWVRRGDVVIGMDGDFNSQLWSREDAALNQRLCILSAKEPFSSSLIAYSLPFILASINELTYATTVKHLASHQITKSVLALPPATEQKAIVEFLDHETAQLDALSEKASSMVDILNERRQALISAAVTGKIDVRGN